MNKLVTTTGVFVPSYYGLSSLHSDPVTIPNGHKDMMDALRYIQTRQDDQANQIDRLEGAIDKLNTLLYDLLTTLKDLRS